MSAVAHATIGPSGVRMRRVTSGVTVREASAGGAPNTLRNESVNAESDSQPWSKALSVTVSPSPIRRSAPPSRRARQYAWNVISWCVLNHRRTRSGATPIAATSASRQRRSGSAATASSTGRSQSGAAPAISIGVQRRHGR